VRDAVPVGSRVVLTDDVDCGGRVLEESTGVLVSYSNAGVRGIEAAVRLDDEDRLISVSAGLLNKQLSERQEALLTEVGSAFIALANECAEDEEFEALMVTHNDLFTMSLDDLAYEWWAVAKGTRVPWVRVGE